MDIYHGWFDKKPDVSDMALARAFDAFMAHLRSEGVIEGARLTRCKLGLGPRHLGEFHLMIEVRDLAQLDRAFSMAARRAGEMEAVHHGLNSLVTNTQFALYRDFPDPVRQEGEERF